MTTTERIINRIGPCRCGCRGKDPWHQTSYNRTVTVTDSVVATVRTVQRFRFPADMLGTVELPWGTQQVARDADTRRWYVITYIEKCRWISQEG